MSKKRYILQCTKPGCGASTEDIRKNPNAWDGWIISPDSDVACPVCVVRAIAHQPTHQLVELESHFGGKVIKTLSRVPITGGVR